jgi:CheY-like chemotaxis protein
MKPSPDGADRPARILIVDDEHDNRELLSIILTREGFLIQTAASGPEALAIVAQQPPDLVLLDVMMPGMTGYEVTAKLKGDPATKHIPVMMVTALHGRNAMTAALSAGAEDCIIKPVDRAELLLRVKKLLSLEVSDD